MSRRPPRTDLAELHRLAVAVGSTGVTLADLPDLSDELVEHALAAAAELDWLRRSDREHQALEVELQRTVTALSHDLVHLRGRLGAIREELARQRARLVEVAARGR